MIFSHHTNPKKGGHHAFALSYLRDLYLFISSYYWFVIHFMLVGLDIGRKDDRAEMLDDKMRQLPF